MNACILTVLYEPVDFIMTRNREAGECNISCRHRIARITNILHSLYPPTHRSRKEQSRNAVTHISKYGTDIHLSTSYI